MALPCLNTSNPLRFFVLYFVIHLASPCLNTSNPLRFFVLYFVIHLASPCLNTSNPLRFFSVIKHSPNTFSFFCKQKAKSIWLIVYNKKRNLIAKISLNREATTRFELVIAVLQTDALPLGYVAIKYRTITL